MGAFRNDEDARIRRLESLEQENSHLRAALAKKEEELAEALDKENRRVNFWLEYGDEQEKELVTKNRELHQEVLLLRSRTPSEIVQAARSLAQVPDVAAQFQVMRKEVRRARLMLLLMLVFYLVSGSLRL